MVKICLLAGQNKSAVNEWTHNMSANMSAKRPNNISAKRPNEICSKVFPIAKMGDNTAACACTWAATACLDLYIKDRRAIPNEAPAYQLLTHRQQLTNIMTGDKSYVDQVLHARP